MPESIPTGENAGLTVVGAGLAGCEAAFAAANAGVPVQLIDMKPAKYTEAHHSPDFAELVCSNSLKASRLGSAAGLLKEEMARLGSVCVAAARACAVPAGGALAVDRERFSALVSERIRSHPLIRVECRELTALPEEGTAVIATGPLTAAPLAEEIARRCGGSLSFYDAAAPIVTGESLDMDHAFRASRYGRDSGGGEAGGEGDYINCPLNKEEYEAFHAALVSAETAQLHAFDKPKVYEGCMPIEVLAGRGLDAIRFGPMKPVGLRDPRTRPPPLGRAPAAGGKCGRDALESRGVSNQPEIRGAEAGVRPDSGSPPGGICPVRGHAPQYLPRFAPPARLRLPF